MKKSPRGLSGGEDPATLLAFSAATFAASAALFTSAVHSDKLRLEGRGGRFSACLLKDTFFGPNMFFCPNMSLEIEKTRFTGVKKRYSI